MERFQYDIAGMRFGMLTAIKPMFCKNHKTYWLCRCDCGNEVLIARPHLSSGRTTSCGCQRAKSTRMHRGFGPKIELPEKDQQWIIEHFKHTRNSEIMEKFGLSEGWLHRFARSHGLKKSRQYRAKIQAEITEKARISNKAHRTFPPKGFRIPRAEVGQFKPGHKETEEVKQKRLAKAVETMNTIRRQEKARVAFGLPQQTKMMIKRQSRRLIAQRHRMMELGYYFDHGGRVAYYDENTNRNNCYERRKLGDRCYVYCEFKPLSEKTA